MHFALLLLAMLQDPAQTPASPPSQEQKPPPPDPNHTYDPVNRSDPNDLHTRNAFEVMQRMTLIRGRVTSAAGGALSAPALVEALCAGSRQQSVFAKDDFHIAITSSGSLLTGGSPNAPCFLRISLTGHQPAFVPLGSPGGMEKDLGVIILRPRAGVSGEAYSATSLYAPDKARKAFERGRDQVRRGKLKDARKDLETATRLHPKYAEAWCELGDVLNRLMLNAEARAAYNKANESDPQYLRPTVHLAMLAAGERQWKESAQLTDQVIARNPHDYPEAFLYNAAALFNLGLADPAEQAVRRAIDLDPAHLFPKSYHLLATILESRGQRREAAANLRLFLQHAPHAPEADQVRRRLTELTTSP
ncbi:MAG: tetratricopeptide repeat protein [Acidobacteria bacterium]|nr:tetratricopeptide repeat protein [Acidobacteriota bacterium]